MIAFIWRYEVKEECRPAFEATYGPTGEWAKMFARSDGFRGTELLRSQDGSYLTIDVWRAKTDLEAFMAAHGADYVALDRRTEAWTIREHRLGEYQVIE